MAAARHLADEGLVAPDRLLIRGGSAGGFTTLAALCFGDTFAAGVKCGVLRPSVPTGGFRVQRMTHDLEADQLELV